MKTSIRGRQPVLAAVLKSTRLVHVGGVRGGGISLPVTMCSCISNFLLPESEVGRKEGRKEEEGVREKKWERQMERKEGRVNWRRLVIGSISLCVRSSACPYTCSSQLDNINFRQYLFSCQVVPRSTDSFLPRGNPVVGSRTQMTCILLLRWILFIFCKWSMQDAKWSPFQFHAQSHWLLSRKHGACPLHCSYI